MGAAGRSFSLLMLCSGVGLAGGVTGAGVVVLLFRGEEFFTRVFVVLFFSTASFCSPEGRDADNRLIH